MKKFFLISLLLTLCLSCAPTLEKADSIEELHEIVLSLYGEDSDEFKQIDALMKSVHNFEEMPEPHYSEYVGYCHSVVYSLAHRYGAKALMNKYEKLLKEDEKCGLTTHLEETRDAIEPESLLIGDKEELKKQICTKSHNGLILRGFYTLSELHKIKIGGKTSIMSDSELTTKIYRQDGYLLGDIPDF